MPVTSKQIIRYSLSPRSRKPWLLQYVEPFRHFISGSALRAYPSFLGYIQLLYTYLILFVQHLYLNVQHHPARAGQHLQVVCPHDAVHKRCLQSVCDGPTIIFYSANLLYRQTFKELSVSLIRDTPNNG